MLKKTIKYTDFDGAEKTGTFYFNFTKAELIEMEAVTPGGMGAKITEIIQTQDKNDIIIIMKKLILEAYGVRGPDNSFVKTPELRESFSHSEAYSELFMELSQDAKATAAFFNGVIPKVDPTKE